MAEFNIRGLQKYTARLTTVAQRTEEELTLIAQDAAEYGADLMREYIATRGTGYVGRGARAVPEGRIDTGLMIDSVAAGTPRKIQNGVSVSFGWIHGWRSYFAKQEEGFASVPPMHALLDATIKTREYFYARVRQAVKK